MFFSGKIIGLGEGIRKLSRLFRNLLVMIWESNDSSGCSNWSKLNPPLKAFVVAKRLNIVEDGKYIVMSNCLKFSNYSLLLELKMLKVLCLKYKLMLSWKINKLYSNLPWRNWNRNIIRKFWIICFGLHEFSKELMGICNFIRN